MRFIALLLAFPLLSIAATRTEHVFIISFDGGNPAIMQQAEMPNFKRLAAEGAYTWQARTILPSKTLPSHTAMLTGVDIAKHQIDWNDFFPLRGQVKVPTVFELLKTAQPQAQTGLFCGKIKFRHLWKPETLDIFNCGSTYGPEPIPATEEKKLVPAQQVVAQAAPYILENKPTLCFIHFPDADSAGHKSGWGSPEQMEAFKVCDQALSQILTAIDKAGLRETSTLILTADHGGSQKNHFQPIPSDITIPWIAWGKGVKKQHSITKDSLFTFDTTATALWLLGVSLPNEFDGEPVLEAFEQQARKTTSD